jgi:hypothetical protein
MKAFYRLLTSSLLFVWILSFATVSCSKSSSTTPSNVDTTKKKTTDTAVKTVCYVEVNSNSMLNVAKYTLTDSGQPFFNIAIIFAANINYDTVAKKAVLFNNSNVSSVLQNNATQVAPLQQKGIKVLLSILGNHQGAGISNFTSSASAKAFAQIITDTVNYYGLDGVDFDDEYANYGANGTAATNDSSFVLLISALRQLMPTKIISFYYIGPSISDLSYNGVTIGSLINYSWNPYYGTFAVPNVPGLSNADISPAAVDLGSTSASEAQSFATQTISGGYGVFLTYDLSSTSIQSYLSGISNILYGTSVTYTP